MRSKPESALRQAIGTCRDGDWWDGLRLLRALTDRRRSTDSFPGYYYSYLGQAMARVEGRKRDGLALCREAVKQQPLQPENYLNLASVQLMLRNRRAAYRAVRQGLAIDPDHPQLRELLRTLGVRRRPILPWWGRAHLINRMLGRAAASWRR